jgi:hypothetical protein
MVTPARDHYASVLQTATSYCSQHADLMKANVFSPTIARSDVYSIWFFVHHLQSSNLKTDSHLR